MFDHEKFDRYPFEEVPLDRDIFVVGERWIKPYEEMMLRFFDGAEYETLGFISWFAARSMCMNCLGVPFETIFAIDEAVRQALREEAHPKAQIYLDEEYYRSLRLPYDFKSNSRGPKHEYQSRKTSSSRYYIPCDVEELITQINREKTNDAARKLELAKCKQSQSRTSAS